MRITIFFVFAIHLHVIINCQNIFKNQPKAELHVHLGGAYPLNWLISYSTPEQAILLKTNIQLVCESLEYSAIFPLFKIISDIVNAEDRVQEGTAALCKELIKDNIRYVEIRTGLKNLRSQQEYDEGLRGYLEAVIAGIEQVASNSSIPFMGKILVSIQRDSKPEYVQRVVELACAYKKHVVGIDISGESTKGDIRLLIPILIQAKEAGLRFSVHMGETSTETDQELIIEQLQPDRIGHGVHLSEMAKNWILTNKVPLEVCLTSARLVKMIEKDAIHPGLLYAAEQKHPIILCTDDSLLFNTSLTKEYELVEKLNILSSDQLTQLANDSFTYSFSPRE